MAEQTIRKYKLFWTWQDDKEEAWLGQMSQQGYHLASLGFPGFYYFTVGEPRNYVYRLDFLTQTKDYPQYLQLFKDAGWEHMGRMGGWQYFRILAQEGESPEIYTDPDSKIQKYGRLLAYLIIFLPIYLTIVSRNLTVQSHEVFRFAGFVLMVVYSVVIIQLIRRISQLKRL
ncbi:MAG TPA: DUF2812 domain-containing protein [Anaerolineae bacterium]|nr:DUF2812 domain-containing protein [Anaerolineae bacterium]HQI83475.1 DUF2812 domain-containing protein [Anaerolineae bacterium]